jgi:pimeloyl-[acyl-carrier protein] synthase
MSLDAATLDIDLTNAPRDRGDALLTDFDRVRENDPVYWSAKSQCWFITRHADVAAGFLKRLPVTNEDRMWAVFMMIPKEDWPTRIPTLVKYSQLWITSSEGPRHLRLRGLIMKAMTRSIVENLRSYAAARAEYLIDVALAAGDIEFNEGISRPMTGDVLFRLLGMPEERFGELKDWATCLMEGVGATIPTPEKLERADWAMAEMNKAVAIEIEKRRKEPKDDLITALLNASEEGDKLTIDEIYAQMHVMIVAGHDTTMNTITLAVAALANHPEAIDYIRANPNKMPDIVQELQRHVGMVGGQPKLISHDFELGGKSLKAGQMAVLLIAAGDRDPTVFANPDKLDFTRDSKPSLVFGPGVHFCLGHQLAKLQLAEFIGALARKVKRVEVLDDALDFMPVWVFRGLYKLNARFTAR